MTDTNENKNSIKSIQRMMRISRGHALVPRNLDMTLFGDKKDKIALILDRVYRAKMYRNDYGFANERHKFTESVGINMEYLTKILREPATPILDIICRSPRHEQSGTEPIEEVLVRVKSAAPGKRSAQYVLAEKYRVKPEIHRMQRINRPTFKHDKEAMEKEIAGWSENYQKVCGNIKMLTLEMDEVQCDKLIQQKRNKYIQDDQEKYVEYKTPKLITRNPKLNEATARPRATAQWERHREKRIVKLDEKNYDKLLFIRDKFLEMEDKDEMPIYALDPQGRLHYYLTNMPEELRQYIRFDGCKMMSYDLKTSQPVFVWIALGEYIRKNEITLNDIKQQANEILDTIKLCNNGIVPDFVQDGFTALKLKRKPDALDTEMNKFGKVLGKDFYADIMKTIEWQSDRKKFKTKVLFPFLYGRYPSWSTKRGRKTIMQYFLKKFPAVYCVLWRMRRFTEICLDRYQMTKEGVAYPDIKKHIDETYCPADFPKEMQRRESYMFYNRIIPQIDLPCVTIHDSVIVQSGKRYNVSEIIKKEFRDLYQIEVCVSCESWYE